MITMILTLTKLSDRPLALYVFSSNAAFKNKGLFLKHTCTFNVIDPCLVFDDTQSGTCVANECLIHCGVYGLPFGGTGPSGCTWLLVLLPSHDSFLFLC